MLLHIKWRKSKNIVYRLINYNNNSCSSDIVCTVSNRTHHGNNSLLALLLLAHHGVGFASSCLAVGKNADIVALECMFQHFFTNVIVHTVL